MSSTTHAILETILSKQIFDYILFDRQLRFVSGSEGIARYFDAFPEPGDELVEYLPELVGNEEEILDLFEKHYSLFALDTLQKKRFYVQMTVEYHTESTGMILLRDMTAVSKVRRELMQNHNEVSLLLNMLQHIIDSQSALLFVVGEGGRIKFANKRFQEFFGIHDPKLYRYIHAEFTSYADLEKYLDGKEKPITVDKETFMVSSTSFESVYTLYTLTKVTTIFNENRHLHQKVKIDPLTGVYRKKVFEEHVDALMRARVPFAVAVADLDDFKQVNDTCGHTAGDETLRQFAAMIRDELIGDELIARWGGEEFLLIMIGQKITEIEERLKAMCRKVATYDFGIAFRVTVSIGVSWRSMCSCETSDTVLRRADRALYEAKNRGKNRVVVAKNDDCKALCH
jgi:diguanylate cyclase (GGDEF)-like protein